MIISLYAGGMTVRDIEHHLASTIGTELSRESISTITDSVLFDHVDVGAGARVHRAILDKNVVLEPGATVGVDRGLDLSRGFTVTDSGITVVGKNARVPR